MHQAVQLPLCADFGLAAQGEAIKSLVEAQVGKDRLHGRHALAVEGTSARRVDGLPHALRVSQRQRLALIEEHHLSNLRSLRMAQALFPQRARHAALLGACEIVVLPAVGRTVRAVAIETLARRADAGIGSLVELEIVGPEVAGVFGLARSTLVIERIGFVPVLSLLFEALVATPHQAIGDHGWNAGVVQFAQVGLTVIAGIGRNDGPRLS